MNEPNPTFFRQLKKAQKLLNQNNTKKKKTKKEKKKKNTPYVFRGLVLNSFILVLEGKRKP